MRDKNGPKDIAREEKTGTRRFVLDSVQEENEITFEIT